MKKKLSIIPLLVVAFTMMFGTLCVWAADPADRTPITKVVINLPETCDGKTAGEFINEITVEAYENNDSPTLITYSEYFDSLSYGTSFSYVTRNSDGYNLLSTDKMEKGIKYDFNIRVMLKREQTTYRFKHVSESDLHYSGTVNYNKSVNPGEAMANGAFNDVVLIKFSYTYDSSSSSSSTPKKTVTLFPHEIYHPVVDVNEAKPVVVPVDRDTFKSEVPAKTVIASEMFDRISFFDLKVHESDGNTKFNQEFLARCMVPGGDCPKTNGLIFDD